MTVAQAFERFAAIDLMSVLGDRDGLAAASGVRTAPDSSPGFNAFIARSKSGTVSPGETHPRSPPLAALASSELAFAWSSNFAPCTIRSRIRSILIFASSFEVVSFTLTRMCRRRVCSMTVGLLRLRVSRSLTM